MCDVQPVAAVLTLLVKAEHKRRAQISRKGCDSLELSDWKGGETRGGKRDGRRSDRSKN